VIIFLNINLLGLVAEMQSVFGQVGTELFDII